MKQKSKTIKIELMVFLALVLTLIPFASCVDFDGDGIDDGEQNLCGDGFCQPTETITTCPSDCSSPASLPASPTINPPITNPSTNEEESDLPSEEQINLEGNSEEQNNDSIETEEIPPITEQANEESFFSGIVFKIILGVIGLIIIGIIIFIVLSKMKKSSEQFPQKKTSAIDSIPQEKIINTTTPDLSYSPIEEDFNSQ
jgi:hypothetical protein